MIKIGRAMGIDVYADTEEPEKAKRLGTLISRVLNPDSIWDWDKDTNCFIERPAEGVQFK